MDGFFSKASSFLSSQAEHGDLPHKEEETRKHASSGYGDLLATAQSFMGSGNPSHGGESVDKGGESHKAPSSGGYGDLLATAQSMMGSTKLSSGDDDDDGTPVDKKEEPHKTTTSSSDSGYGDVYASAQVLMGAAKATRGGGAAADMGEVAGATSNLIGAAVRYGHLEKGAYGEYAHKAQAYLQEYQTSHGKTGHKPSSTTSEGKNEEDCDAPPSWKHAEAGHGHQDE